MNTTQFTTHATNLGFTEAPRWHNNALYFSDFNHQLVRRLDPNGNIEIVARVPHSPSGLGWLPDGRMLIVSMSNHKLLLLESSGQLTEYADLSAIATGVCNDMVVDHLGRAWVGNFGAANITLESKVTANLALVDIDGTVSVAARNLYFPNGAVISADGKQLIIAETLANRLTAFDITADGSLSNRHIWADITPSHPDGICQDSEGGIWVATVYNEVIRVKAGGEVTDRIQTPQGCYACALGGEDRRRLYLCTNGPKGGAVISTRVDVAGI